MFGGLSIGLNHGIMEYWNYGRVGFRKDIVDYKFYHQDDKCPKLSSSVCSPGKLPTSRGYRPEGMPYELEANTHYSIIPAFQHSKGAKPLS